MNLNYEYNYKNAAGLQIQRSGMLQILNSSFLGYINYLLKRIIPNFYPYPFKFLIEIT